ncbi:glycosyltransferase family 2 protein [Pontibacter saemangeumensis]|uniref:Glycosyltransferase family 2 protein n=1 Tax=Pontibacter saemangeumensis TaxID=1084525 RepID=A0ABP8LDB5_9BACT
MATKVAVIIVTYNGLQWIDKCIGLLRNSSLPLTPIVVDNCSTDGTTSYIENNYPEVMLIKSNINLGFGKGNNLGIEKGLALDYDYFFLLNQDAWIESNTVEELVVANRNNPQYGILSPMHLNGVGSSLDSLFSRYLSSYNIPEIISDLYLSKLQPVYTTNFINAAAWLVSRKCLETVGLFDPIFPHYGEDEDYAHRTLSLGYKIGLVTTVKIFHDRDNREPLNISLNLQRSYIKNVLNIKNLNGKFLANLVFVLKSEIDQLFTYLIFRRIKEAKVKGKVIYKTISNLRPIHKSYLLNKGK